MTDQVLTNVTNMANREIHRLGELKRHVTYALSVHEPIANKDQETISKYVLLLEHTLDRVLHRRHNLEYFFILSLWHLQILNFGLQQTC